MKALRLVVGYAYEFLMATWSTLLMPACLPAWHRDMDMGIRAIGQHSTEMPITATVWGFWLLVVSVWLGKSLPWLPRQDSRAEQANERANERAVARRQGAFNQCYCRLSKSLAATSFHSQAAICHSSGEQETPSPAPAPAPRPVRRRRRHQNQSGNLWQRSHSTAIWTVRLSVPLSVCPGIGSELGLLLFLLLLLLLFVLLFAGWQWKWCNHIAHGSCHCAFACCLQNNWFCVHILDTNKQRTHTETHSHTLTLSLCVPLSPTLSAEAVENFWIKFNKAKAF